MFSIAQPSDKQQVIDLWKIAFGDSDDFIRLFFDRVYRDEQTYVIRQNGQVVSALQILPYDMAFCGGTISAGYICGVSTLPSERGKGLMSKLMYQALEAMGQQGYDIAILIPATPSLFDLYGRFDFVSTFDYMLEDIQADSSVITGRNSVDIIEIKDFNKFEINQVSFNQLFTYYHAKQLQRQDSILHNAYQFEIICQDRWLGDAEIWVATENKQLTGLALTDPISNDIISIREIIGDNEIVKNQLVQSILNIHGLQRAKLRVPTTQSQSVTYQSDNDLHVLTSSFSIPYGMARIINKNKMIDLWQSFNHALLPSDCKSAGTASLTQKLLLDHFHPPYMNLMLD
ncbi:MAG: GNAT family N-acetyltransferase [Tannerella sp.]|jgi:predicted acetyltransferase|nr:GNAT family N-acetyltransferase [Tannerella sp.]